MNPQEQEAIRCVLRGDPDAYRVLMDRHLPAVLRMTLRVTGSLEDAEEAAQEAFLRAYDKLPTFREEASFGAWVYRIATNCALNLVERRSRDLAWRATSLATGDCAENLATSHHGTPESLLLEAEQMHRREELLARLTSMERTAFVAIH